MTPLLSVAQVAERLGVSSECVRGLLLRGLLRHYVVGKRRRVSEEQLAEYLRQNERGPAPAVQASPPLKLKHVRL